MYTYYVQLTNTAHLWSCVCRRWFSEWRVRMRSTALAPLCGGARRCCLNTHTQGSQAANHGECKETERSGRDWLWLGG